MDSCCQHCAPAGAVDFTLLLTAGFTMSLGHCVGMCGPILSAYSISQREAGSRGAGLLPPMARYHLGRILAYAAIGIGLGWIGSAATAPGTTRLIQGSMALVVGCLMVAVALGIAGVLPTQGWVEAAPLGRAISRTIATSIRSRSRGRQFLLGLANGFLPCGPVLAAALGAAASGQWWRGGVGMLCYGLGTVPILLTLGFGASRIPQSLRTRMHRLGSVLLLLVALQLVLRGLAAFGVVPHRHIGSVVLW